MGAQSLKYLLMGFGISLCFITKVFCTLPRFVFENLMFRPTFVGVLG